MHEQCFAFRRSPPRSLRNVYKIYFSCSLQREFYMFELRIARELPANYNSTNNKINQFKLRRKLARRVYRISACRNRGAKTICFATYRETPLLSSSDAACKNVRHKLIIYCVTVNRERDLTFPSGSIERAAIGRDSNEYFASLLACHAGVIMRRQMRKCKTVPST